MMEKSALKITIYQALVFLMLIIASGVSVGAKGLDIPDSSFPMKQMSPDRISSSELDSFTNKTFDEVKPGTYFQAQRFNQKGMGQFFTPVKPMNSMDAEEMLNLKAWGNNADQVSIVEIKPGLQAWRGGIKGGTGQQIFIPHDFHSEFVNVLDTQPLFVEELKWLTRP